MPLMIRQIEPNAMLDEHLALDALGGIISPTVLAQALASHGRPDRRVRKLPMTTTLLVCIAMNLFAHEALPAVFRRLVSGLRWIWPSPEQLTVTKGGLCQARYRLGAQPLVSVFHAVCQPLATATTPGAFLFGARVMALDGAKLDVPDTLANERAFGRPPTTRGTSAWPQVLVVALCECGTHAICDAGVWRQDASEDRCARRLLRSLTPEMLVMWDRGLYSFDLASRVRACEAHFLARMPASVKPTVVATLADGTQLVRLQPSDGKRRRAGEALLARLIRYTLDDPQRSGQAVEHRLITSLLDPVAAPAVEVIVAYHTRWEFELTVDELVTHQRPIAPLRSQKPVGVIQEVYALLLAHYLVRTVMAEAATTAAVAPTQLSFLDSLRLLREAIPDFQRSASQDHPRIYQTLLADIVAAKLPPRANRINPRVVKQKMSRFKVKRPAHRHPPQPTKPFRDAVVLLN